MNGAFYWNQNKNLIQSGNLYWYPAMLVTTANLFIIYIYIDCSVYDLQCVKGKGSIKDISDPSGHVYHLCDDTGRPLPCQRGLSQQPACRWCHTVNTCAALHTGTGREYMPTWDSQCPFKSKKFIIWNQILKSALTLYIMTIILRHLPTRPFSLILKSWLRCLLLPFTM